MFMLPRNTDKMLPEQKKLIRRSLYLGGLLFFTIGAVSFAKPEWLASIYLDFEDPYINRIFGSALMAVGGADFMIARSRLYSDEEKK